jgi:predicted permease
MSETLRSLLRAPGLTAISILTIALGVGAGTALFSVVKAVLLNPLPYLDPARLVWIAPLGEARQELRVSLPDFDDWHAGNRSLARIAAYADAPFLAGGGSNPERTRGAMVTEDFFDLLGAAPMLGRLISPQEHQTGPPLGVAVISHGLWQRVYGGDPNIIGRPISLVGLRTQVIGVMPPGFSYPAGADLWVSARSLRDGNIRSARNYYVIGRLKAGVTLETARRELQAMVTPLESHLTGGVRTPLLFLFASVGLLLLIVCINIANLLLVRVTARSRELAVRAALGAGSRRLFRGLLAESLVLAAAGGALGLLLANWSMEVLRAVIPASVPRAAEVRLDFGVMLFGLALSGLAGVLFGTLPSWRATRVNLHDALKAAPRGLSATRRALGLQSALMISEVALSLMLTVAAGLLLSSFMRLRAVDPGFRGAGTLAARISSPMNPAERARIAGRFADILRRVRALPGVDAAGVIRDVPFDPIELDAHFTIEGRGKDPSSIARWQVASPGTMEALGIPLLHGRRFTEADTQNAPSVAVISHTMAQRYWPGRNPIGERIWFDGVEPREHWLTIVGIAGDVRQSGLAQPAPPMVYACYAQLQIPPHLVSASVLVRAAIEPRSLIPALREAIRQAHPQAAVKFQTLDDVLSVATARQRFQMQILTGFAAMALLLALVGLYGVMSYLIASNRVAIGIRMALGARPADVFRSVVARAVQLAGAGCGIGIAGCVAARDALSKVLFGVGPSDPGILASAVLGMLSVTLVACWLPAKRAMGVDPAEVLKGE